jgi:hypothetical protein
MLPANYFQDFNRQFGEGTDWQGRAVDCAAQPQLRVVFERGRDKFSELIAYDVVVDLNLKTGFDVLAVSLTGIDPTHTEVRIAIPCDCQCLRDIFTEQGILPLLADRHHITVVDVLMPVEADGTPGQVLRLAA